MSGRREDIVVRPAAWTLGFHGVVEAPADDTAWLRDEVDLDSVRADLLDVVHDTIRPAHARVWLRGRARGGP